MIVDIQIANLDFGTVVHALLLNKKNIENQPVLRPFQGLAPAAVNKLFDVMPNDAINKLAAFCIDHFHIPKTLTKAAYEQGIPLIVDSIKIYVGNTISIKADIQDGINYDAAFHALLSKMLKERSIQNNLFLSSVLDALSELPPNAVGQMLNQIPDHVKKKLVNACIHHYNGKICNMLTNVANTRGIRMTVSSVSISLPNSINA